MNDQTKYNFTKDELNLIFEAVSQHRVRMAQAVTRVKHPAIKECHEKSVKLCDQIAKKYM